MPRIPSEGTRICPQDSLALPPSSQSSWPSSLTPFNPSESSVASWCLEETIQLQSPSPTPWSCFLLTRPPHPARLVSLLLKHTGDFPALTVPVLTSPFSRPPFSQEAFGVETFSHPSEITSLLSDSVLSLACVSCSSLGRLRAFMRPAGGARTALRLQLLGQVSPRLILTPAL